MAKVLKKVIKVKAKGGAANPAPPLGPALGQAGVDINAFCTKFNAQTQNRKGEDVPVVLRVYEDRSFDFILKQATATSMILAAAKKDAGSGEPNKNKVGSITKAQLRQIAEKKMPDLNATDIEAAEKIIAGSARSMGITVQ